MIKTRIVELIPPTADGVNEKELGWAFFAEVPVDRRPLPMQAPGDRPPTFNVMKINDENYLVIGGTWVVVTRPTEKEAMEHFLGEDEEAHFVLIVQAMPRPSSIVIAGGDVLSQLDAKGLNPEGRKPN